MRREVLKRKLAAAINTLSADDLPKVLNLVGKLKAKRTGRQRPSATQGKSDPAKNPLRGLLGLGAVEPFAFRIDEDLYGKPR